MDSVWKQEEEMVEGVHLITISFLDNVGGARTKSR